MRAGGVGGDPFGRPPGGGGLSRRGRISLRRRALAAGAVVVLAACGSQDGEVPSREVSAGAASAAAVSAAEEGLVQSHELPAGAPDGFGFGTEATAVRVAAWDIDVKPDGEGLPPGRGTVAEGEVIYERTCVACHGPTGVEGPNDRLVGTAPWRDWPQDRAVGNYWPYATTLYDYIGRAMPQTEPGSLTADEKYAVIAYLLHLNELVPADAVMDSAALAAVEMPARDRFVTDDRTDGPEIR